ncbi:putative tryptophan dimethylallyltransferase [Aspergillus caelatus]|uniref:Putative tryptophan dimethylallyltransferase n=1 Tax=Aspergillus caelatus TaxID=61420 RepID=A0A5N7ABS5_9EURO|nr:putative tryptophan dimethylallyltransferase [Aspergillus caelatus]KAE8367175.1 putative tryptophan dimethylallyltransferase [Aspergillus caelatus]
MHIPCSLNPMSFESLTETLEFPNESWKQWWYKTGPILVKLMISSNYSIERQQQYLKFYACVIVPFLGPYPQVVRSTLTRSGLPVEFSVNYQQHGKQPTVRIAFEPLSGARGTEAIAYDRDIANEFLSTLSELDLKGFDSRLWDTVSQNIHIDATEKAILEKNRVDDTYVRTQTLFGFDLFGNGTISVKVYAFPGLKCKVSGQSSRELLATTVKDLQRQVDCAEAFSMVDRYLQESNSYNPFTFFSWDCIEPLKCRLKFYMCSASMTRAKLEEVWSLGSRLQGSSVDNGLRYLLQLFDHIQIPDGELEIKVEHDDRSDTSKTTPLMWNYEMRSGDPSPLTKIYLPVHGENDLKIATGIAHFMEEIGMVDIGKSYLDIIQSYFPENDLERTDRLTSWISFAFTEKIGVYISVYYHSSTDNPWAAEEKQY